jgi:hypothetical protein
VCYFKSNTIAESGRGQGLGGKLLAASKAAVMAQGAKAGVSHLWQQSPNNAAVRYFTKAGGKLIKQHPQRWHQRYMGEDYICVLCGEDCHCVACEMLLVFNDILGSVDLCWLNFVRDKNVLIEASGLLPSNLSYFYLTKSDSTKSKMFLAEPYGQRLLVIFTALSTFCVE